MIRLIASDMDGTLLDGRGRVPEETYPLIERLAGLGVRFVAASGRIHEVLRAQFAPVEGLVDYICANGAEVWVAGERVARTVFDADVLARLVGAVEERGDATVFMSDGRTISFSGPEAQELVSVFERDGAFAGLELGMPADGAEIIKLSLRVVEGADPAEAARDLGEAFAGELDVHVAAERFIDVNPAGVDKGAALARVLEARGIDSSEVLAFGDAMNDLGMLDLAGESVAMGNALPAVRKACDRVIGTYREHAAQAEMAALAERLEAGS